MLCQSCGRPLPPGAQFCGECGAQIGAPSSPLEVPAAPTVPEGLPAPGAVLPPNPPLANSYGSFPPPPPPTGGPPPEFVAGAPSGGGGRRNVMILAGLGVVLVLVLVGLGLALAATLGDDDEEAAPPSTVVTVPEAPTTLPPVSEVPTTVAPPTTDADPVTPGEPSDASATVEAFCASAEELGALLQDAIDDPFGADPQQITELSAELSEQAAALTATATPEELARISECTEALNVTP